MLSVHVSPQPPLRVVLTCGVLVLALCQLAEATSGAAPVTGPAGAATAAPRITPPALPDSLLTDTVASTAQAGRRQHDSLWNGVLIGAGVGALVGLAVIPRASCGNDTECSAIVTLAIGLPVVAAGAGIGAVVDAIRHEGREQPRRFDVAPIVGRGTTGMQVQWNVMR